MKNDILIVYYSWSGNTRAVAELTGQKTGGKLFEIEPVQSYSSNYREVVEQAKKEIKCGFRPVLKAIPEVSSYKTVFLGSPIWCGTMAPPLFSFIESFDLKEKTVIPFHTHGGGGVSNFERDVIKMCPDSAVMKGFGTYNRGGNETEAQMAVWLKDIGI